MHVCVIFRLVSDGECVTVCAFLAQDSDITKGLKVSEVSVEISVSAYIMKSAQLIRGCASENPVNMLKRPSAFSVELHGCCKQSS